MRLLVFGGDERMTGAAQAARRAGWEALHVRDAEDARRAAQRADAVLLPWPVSFRDEMLVGGSMTKEQTLELLPPCTAALYGAGVNAGELSVAQCAVNPAHDEGFLLANAELTAEGAIFRAMQHQGSALMGSTCTVTGFGRIARALVKRLTAMGAFVIVCARSEKQMQSAHEMGAHPVPLARLGTAAAQSDVIFNTVPARVMGEDVLHAVGKDALIIELASAPYGMDMELASRLGVAVALESGLPGRYAPYEAGAALFEAAQRAVCGSASKQAEGGEAHG